MGFTISHMAAVLPLYGRRKYLPFDALLIGSMLPDLPYFFMEQDFKLSHQWIGIFYFCLPWGLCCLLSWRYLCAPAMYVLVGIQTPSSSELGPYRRQCIQGLLQLLSAALALILGASTHLIWDGITHHDGWISSQVMFLQRDVVLPIMGAMPLTRFLQYLSSALGLLYLMYFFYQIQREKQWKLRRERNAISQTSRYIFAAFTVVCVMSMVFQKMYQYNMLLQSDQYLWFAKILVGMIQGLMISILIYTGLYWLWCLKKTVCLMRWADDEI